MLEKVVHKKGKKWRCFLLTLIFLLCLAENILVFRSIELIPANWRSLFQDSPIVKELGWINRPNCSSSASVPALDYAAENVDEKGRRYSGKDLGNPQKRFLFMGDSWTFGTELADTDIFAWKLQKKFSRWQFDNYAVPAYGTSQCWKYMEYLLSMPDCPDYDACFYFSIGCHLSRNYTFCPGRIYPQNTIMNPYARIEGGHLKYMPADIPYWPGMETFHIISWSRSLYYTYLNNIAALNDNEALKLYYAILEEMSAIADKNGKKFIVADLEKKIGIPSSLSEKGVIYLDLTFPDIDKPQYRMGHDMARHPTPEVHDYWTEKLSAFLEKEFANE